MKTPQGPAMPIPRGYPFLISGMRWRTSETGAVYTTTACSLRIGLAGSAAILDMAMSEDATDPLDPSWYLEVTDVETALLVATAYRYVFVDTVTGYSLLEGAVSVRPLPL